MRSQSIDIQRDLIKFDVILEGHKITIYSEGGEIGAIYNPRNPDDINRLCQSANIDEFIKEDDKKYPHLLVFKSMRYNHGVIANEAIKKNKIICTYLGEIGSLDKVTHPRRVKKTIEKELKISASTHSPEAIKKAINSYINYVTHYAFEITTDSNPNDTVLAHKKRSLAGFINHNTTDPNVIVEISNNVIYYKAKRHVKEGEQLTVDYGPDYDYQDPLFYIHSTENHLRPGKFLATNIHYYHKIPIKLNAIQKQALQTQNDFVMLPEFLYALFKNDINTKIKLNEYEKRLPIIEISQFHNTRNKYTIHAPQYQQHITPLMFACAEKNTSVIDILIKKHKVDVFAKTVHDKDALIIALEYSESEKSFIKLTKSIIKKIVSTIERTDTLASNYLKQSVLHMLVDLEWCHAITLFNHKIFFDVIDGDGYDPLIAAIATGKIHSIKTLLKMECVRKILNDLLLAEDELFDALVLKRALNATPRKKFAEICQILLKTTGRRPSVIKRIRKIIKIVSR